MTPLIEQIYRDRAVIDADGRTHPLDSQIDPDEGRFLCEFIRARPRIAEVLEIGCAFGLSSLHIAEALKDRPGARLHILDPFQHTSWHGIGACNLARAGIGFFELEAELSELALPRLTQERPATFDLVFIDGWHTFDHTLLDLFYANRLIKEGGFIVVDDCTWPSVAKAVDYVLSYPCYRLVGGTALKGRRRLANRLSRAVPRDLAQRLLPLAAYERLYLRTRFPGMVALEKVAADERDWTWFKSF